MSRYVWLHLDEPPRILAKASPDESLRELVVKVLTRWPFLPVSHLVIDEIVVASLFTAPRPPAAPAAPPRPAPLVEAHGPAPLTVGQQRWRQERQRKALAERHREHWIAKDEAKKAATPRKRKPPPPTNQ